MMGIEHNILDTTVGAPMSKVVQDLPPLLSPVFSLQILSIRYLRSALDGPGRHILLEQAIGPMVRT
jgi:hypothetical protein